MRDIPIADLSRMFKAQAGNWVALNCIEIAHPDRAVMRYVQSKAHLTHQGNLYHSRGFEIAYPAQKRDALGDGSITIDDTDLELTYWVRGIDRTKRTTLTLFTVSTTDLDVKIVAAHTYRILEALPSGPDIHFTLSYSDALREPFPWCKFDDHYPGLHKAIQS